MIGALQVATKKVDDPWSGAKLLVSVNRNEDAIEWLFSKRLISIARYAVACRFRRLHEAASIGSVPAIDYTKPMVSGGVPGDVFTDQLVSAGQEMSKVARAVGQEAMSFLSQLIGVGASFTVVAERYAAAYDMPAREARGFVRGRLCEALDGLGRHWGMIEAKGPRRSRGLRGGAVAELVAGAIDYDEEITIYDLRED